MAKPRNSAKCLRRLMAATRREEGFFWERSKHMAMRKRSAEIGIRPGLFLTTYHALLAWARKRPLLLEPLATALPKGRRERFRGSLSAFDDFRYQGSAALFLSAIRRTGSLPGLDLYGKLCADFGQRPPPRFAGISLNLQPRCRFSGDQEGAYYCVRSLRLTSQGARRLGMWPGLDILAALVRDKRLFRFTA